MTTYRVITRRERDGKTIQQCMKEFSDKADAEEFADFMMDSYISDRTKDYDYEIEMTEVVKTWSMKAVKE